MFDRYLSHSSMKMYRSVDMARQCEMMLAQSCKSHSSLGNTCPFRTFSQFSVRTDSFAARSYISKRPMGFCTQCRSVHQCCLVIRKDQRGATLQHITSFMPKNVSCPVQTLILFHPLAKKRWNCITSGMLWALHRCFLSVSVLKTAFEVFLVYSVGQS